ncbi:MAG TPA: FAD-dependent oxidoreductase [Candidatus Limnocylindria bacterium]|nr:FAD-dependent oxidoreductase [Candidatus Limnocylindria bacterium]
MADFDLIIIGGGPAGLTAGLYAARANMSVVLLESKDTGGEILNTDLIEDWPGEESITGRELADKMAAHARKFGLDIRPYSGVKRVRTEGDRKVVELEDGTTHRAYAVIVAVGGEPVKLGVPGEKEFAGRGVSYCAVCDGAFFKGADLAVVGGGDSAFQEGLFLTRYAKKLYLVHRRDEYRAQAILQDRLLGMDKVQAIAPAQVKEIGGDGDVKWIEVERDGKRERVPVEGVFIFVGFRPLGRRLFDEHIDHDEDGYLVTDQYMRTSIPGVYAVGDTRAQLAKQITTAVGDATTAVLHAERYIEGLKHAEKAFPRADERALAEAARDVGRRRYRAGETVVRAGDPASDLYIVLRGELTVSKDGQDVDTIREGDYFGELGLLAADHRRTATVRAKTDVELLALGKDAFERIVRSSQGVAEDVAARVEERLGRAKAAR